MSLMSVNTTTRQMRNLASVIQPVPVLVAVVTVSQNVDSCSSVMVELVPSDSRTQLLFTRVILSAFAWSSCLKSTTIPISFRLGVISSNLARIAWGLRGQPFANINPFNSSGTGNYLSKFKSEG